MVLSPTFPVSQPNESVTERDFRYMTSAVGGGGESQKSRQKEQNQLISVCDKGGRVSKNPILRTSKWKPPNGKEPPPPLQSLANKRCTQLQALRTRTRSTTWEAEKKRFHEKKRKGGWEAFYLFHGRLSRVKKRGIVADRPLILKPPFIMVFQSKLVSVWW